MKLKAGSFLFVPLSIYSVCFGSSNSLALEIDQKQPESCIRLALDGSDRDLDIVGMSVLRSGTIQQYIDEYQSAIYQRNAAITYFAPTVNLSFSTSYNYNPTYDSTIYDLNTDRLSGSNDNNVTQATIPEYTMNNPNLLANWNIIDISQIYQIESLGFTAKAVRYESALQANQAISSAINYYISYLQEKQTSQAASVVVASLKKTVADVRQLYAAGQRSLIDVLSLKQQLDSYQSTLESTLSSADLAKGNLDALLYRPICNHSTDIEASKTYQSLHQISSQYFSDSLTTALATYPQLANLSANAKAYQKMADSYASNYLPTLSFSANLQSQYEYGNISGRMSNPPYQYDVNQTNYIMATATWNIFDGGNNIMNMQSQRKLSSGYLESLNQAEKALHSIYQAAILGDIKLSSSMTYIEDSLKAALQSQVLVNIAYKAGYKSYLDIINSVQSVYESLSTLASTQASYASNRYTLLAYLSYPNLQSTHEALKSLYDSGSLGISIDK